MAKSIDRENLIECGQDEEAAEQQAAYKLMQGLHLLWQAGQIHPPLMPVVQQVTEILKSRVKQLSLDPEVEDGIAVRH
ncbi:MAG TPA: hypothetical protein VK564_09935 [Thermodesulfobacteriota bacterium]|nr:hypothetical protein [Thermodesulfobacteriota bacterium]